MTIMQRAEAASRGLSKYFTGKPCKSGHISKRYTTSGSCCQCIAESRSTTVQQLNMVRAGKALYVKDMHPDDMAALRKYHQALLDARALTDPPQAKAQPREETDEEWVARMRRIRFDALGEAGLVNFNPVRRKS